MINNETPLYLSSLVPPPVGDRSIYICRNSDNTQSIAARSNLYANSFLPTVIREWNELPTDIRNCDSLQLFKLYLNRER